MIRRCMVALLLTAAMLAQGTPAPKVNIVLPEWVHSEKGYVRYEVAASYPAEVIFVPVGFNDSTRQSH